MSLDHLLRDITERIFLQPIDQHFENRKKSEDALTLDLSLSDYDEKERDVKFYFSFDEDEDTNDVSTVDGSDEYETLRHSIGKERKNCMSQFLLNNGDYIKKDIEKIKNETFEKFKSFQLNKFILMNQMIEMQKVKYLSIMQNNNAGNNGKDGVDKK